MKNQAGNNEMAPKVKIKSVRFSGNKVVKTSELKNAIKIDGKRWFILPRHYTEEELVEDVRRLESVYAIRGHLEPNITPETKFTHGKSKVNITFTIDEGPVYSIEKVVLNFVNAENEIIEEIVLKSMDAEGGQRRTGKNQPDEERLRAQVKLEPGEIYNQRKVESDNERLLKLYREDGFIDAMVTPRSKLAERRPKFVSEIGVSVEFEIPVEFEIFEGDRFRIGRIDIIGNEETQDKVIRRVLDGYGFQPGQWYNADIAPKEGGGELERSIRRRVFAETAIIKPVPYVYDEVGRKVMYEYDPDKAPQVYGRDVGVDVNEGLSGMWQWGAGVSSDSGVIGQLVYDRRNFDINDWPESWGEVLTGEALRGAGQRMRIALEPGTEVSQYSVSFSEPYLPGYSGQTDEARYHLNLDVSGLSYERGMESYDEGRLKGYVGFTKQYISQERYRDRWYKSIGLRVEDVDVDSVDVDAPKEIKSVEGGNALAGVKFSIGRDDTDDEFNPSRGYNFKTGYEQVTGDHTFGILSGTHRWYKTLDEDLVGRKTILATKLLAATALGDAPPFEKFYAGGSGIYGIRGFEYRGVSTRGLQTNVVNPKRKDPIGSDWIFLANAEVALPLASESLAALFFVDTGAIDSGNYRASIGTGIQILIPQWFGPVPMRFEIATPFMKDDDDDTQVFSFSVGRLF